MILIVDDILAGASLHYIYRAFSILVGYILRYQITYLVGWIILLQCNVLDCLFEHVFLLYINQVTNNVMLPPVVMATAYQSERVNTFHSVEVFGTYCSMGWEHS